MVFIRAGACFAVFAVNMAKDSNTGSTLCKSQSRSKGSSLLWPGLCCLQTLCWRLMNVQMGGAVTGSALVYAVSSPFSAHSFQDHYLMPSAGCHAHVTVHAYCLKHGANLGPCPVGCMDWMLYGSIHAQDPVSHAIWAAVTMQTDNRGYEAAKGAANRLIDGMPSSAGWLLECILTFVLVRQGSYIFIFPACQGVQHEIYSICDQHRKDERTNQMSCCVLTVQTHEQE